MIKRITHLAKNPLIAGSTIIFISSTAANFFHFLFNLYMGRSLSVANYGILASLISLISLSGFFSAALMPTIIKFSAEHFANKEYHKAKKLFLKTNQISFIVGGLIVVVFIIFQKNISMFFNFPGDASLIVITGCITMASLLTSTNSSFIQAKLSFNYLSMLTLLSAIIKFGLGAFLVLLGFQINGALFGILFASIIPYFFSFFPLRDMLKNTDTSTGIDTKQLFAYGVPAALCTFSLTSLVSSDLILVKHFYDPKVAGLYAGLSLVGKVIFFFSLPIGSTMFPIVVQRYTRKENYTSVFLLSILLLLLCCFAILSFYFVFPNFVISFFLKKQEYYSIANFLGLFGLLISLYSLLYLVVNFFLSIKATLIWIPLTLGAILQVVLIWNFHQSFMQVISVSLSIISLLLMTLLLYYYLKVRHI